MSTRKPKSISTKVTLKFLPEDATIEGTRFPLTTSNPCLTLLIKRQGKPETIGLFVETGSSVKINVGCKLVNNDTTKSFSANFTRIIETGSGWPSYIRLKRVLDRNKGWLDRDGNLTLEVTVSDPDYHCKVRAESELIENVFKRVKSVENLTICSGDGKEYTMNEDIFASHSELLTTHLRNKSSGKVVFKSVPSHVMDEFIFYLKNGSINESAESVAFDLADLAHMYDMRRLFDLLEPFLVKKVASGQLTRVMKIAKLFRSKPLFEAIGEIEEVLEEHLSDESGDFTVEVHGETLSINQAFLALKYPLLAKYKDELTIALQGTTLQAAKGLIGFLKTSEVDSVAECLFEYASLASALQLPELMSEVEEEVVSNVSKYDRRKVEDLAESTKSVDIFHALATLP